MPDVPDQTPLKPQPTDRPTPAILLELPGNDQVITWRPQSWTFLSIASRVVAVFSILCHILALMLWLGMLGSVTRPAQTPDTLKDRPLALFKGDQVGWNGMPKAKRESFVKRFSIPADARQPDRLAMLDRLLAQCGNDLASSNPESTILPISPSPDRRVQGSLEDGLYFKVPAGEITLSTTRATFKRTGAIETDVVDQMTADRTFGAESAVVSRRLNAVTVNQTVESLKQQFPTLTDPQVSLLANQLSGRLIRGKIGTAPPHPLIEEAYIGAHRELRIRFNGTPYILLANGKLVSGDIAQGMTIDFETGDVRAADPKKSPPLDAAWPAAAMAAHCLVGALLAGYLFRAGLWIGDGSPPAASMFLRWAVAKIILMGLEVFFVSRFTEAVTTIQSQRVSFDTNQGMFGLTASLVAQSIYLIVVLCVLFGSKTPTYVAIHGAPLRLLPYAGRWRVAAKQLMGYSGRTPRYLTGLILLGLVIVHFLSAIGQAGDAAWLEAAGHVLILVLAGLATLRLFGFGSPSSQAAALLLLAIFPATSPAQTRPAGPATSQVATDSQPVRVRAETLLQQIDDADRPGANATLIEVAKMGSEAVPAICQFFSVQKDTRYVLTVTRTWLQTNAIHDPTFRTVLSSQSFQFSGSASKRAIGARLMNVVGTEQRLLPYWVSLSMDEISQVYRTAIQNVLKIDPTGRALVPEIVRGIRAGNRPLQIRLALNSIAAKGNAGRETIQALFNHPDQAVRKYIAEQNLPGFIRPEKPAQVVTPQPVREPVLPPDWKPSVDQLRAGDAATRRDFLTVLRTAAPNKQIEFIQIALSPGMPNELPLSTLGAMAFPPPGERESDALARNVIPSMLSQTSTQFANSGKAAREILLLMADPKLGRPNAPGNALLHVLHDGSPEAQFYLSSIVTLDTNRDYVGPASLDYAKRLLGMSKTEAPQPIGTGSTGAIDKFQQFLTQTVASAWTITVIGVGFVLLIWISSFWAALRSA